METLGGALTLFVAVACPPLADAVIVVLPEPSALTEIATIPTH